MLSLENQDGTHSVAATELRDSARESGYAGQAFDFACQVHPAMRPNAPLGTALGMGIDPRQYRAHLRELQQTGASMDSGATVAIERDTRHNSQASRFCRRDRMNE
jgi:hypothetical protein